MLHDLLLYSKEHNIMVQPVLLIRRIYLLNNSDRSQKSALSYKTLLQMSHIYFKMLEMLEDEDLLCYSPKVVLNARRVSNA